MKEAREQANDSIFEGLATEEILKSKRDTDTDFINAKATFDQAKAILEKITNDIELKSALNIPGVLGNTIQSLWDYLAKADKQKEYNGVLSSTFADLTDLKAKVTDTAEDKKNAEVAKAAIPILTAAAGWTLVTEVTTGLSEAIKDGSKDLDKEVQAIKKNPLKKIAELFGFTDSGIANDIKEALSEKKAGWFEGFFAGIKIWFYGFMAKMMGVDISKSLTPEEMKLAGIKWKIEAKPGITPEMKEKWHEFKESSLYVWSYKALVLMNSIWWTLPNPEWKITSINRRQVANIFDYDTFANQSYSNIESIYQKYSTKTGNWKIEILNALGLQNSEFNPEYVLFACSLLVSNELQSTKVIRKQVNQKPTTNIRDLMTNIHDEFHPMIAMEDMSLDLGELLKDGFTGDMTKLFSPFSNMYTPNESGGYSDEKIKDKAVKLWLNEANFLQTVALRGKELNINNLSDDTIAHLEWADLITKEKLRKLTTFWTGMKGMIINNFSLGHKGEYEKFMTDSQVNLRTVVKFYLATNGNFSDVPDVSWPRKMAIYALIWSDVFTDSPRERGELVNKPWIEALQSWIVSPPGITDRIPENVKDVVLKSMAIGKDAILDKLGKYTSEIWHSIPNEYLIGGGIIATIGLYILFQMRYFKWLVTWLAVWAIASSVIWVLWAGIPKDRLTKEGKFITSDWKEISKDQAQVELEKSANK